MCTKPRYRSRWCKSHKPQFQDDGDHKRYSNPYAAKVAFPDAWLSELRLMAKFKYVLPQTIPADFTILLEWCPDQTSPAVLVAVFLAQTLKWPPAVRALYDIVRQVVEPATAGVQAAHGSTNSADTATARAMAMAYRSAIVAVNGLRLKDMFDRMNTGLMHAQAGVAAQGAEFGFVSKEITPRLGEAIIVLLGPAQILLGGAAERSNGLRHGNSA